MRNLLVLFSIAAALLGLIGGGLFGVMFVGVGLILAVLALMSQQAEQHAELMAALGHEPRTETKGVAALES